MVPAWAKRLTVPDSETPARSKMAVGRLIARREGHLREKTLWRMLYETVGRSAEILGVNTEELDFAGRRCLVWAKGTRTKASCDTDGHRTRPRVHRVITMSRVAPPSRSRHRLGCGQLRR